MKKNLNKFSDKTFGNILLSKLIKINFIIIISIILLGFVGVASLYSAAGGSWEPWAKKHLIRFIFGFILMLILSIVPPKFFFKFSIISFFLGIFSLILVKFIGTVDERIVKSLRDKKQIATQVMGERWKEWLKLST